MSQPPRRPRSHGVGGKLTVLKTHRGWEVLYVVRVTGRGLVWSTPLRPHTTDAVGGPAPFEDWVSAMRHARTLRPWFGDQVRGDWLVYTRKRRQQGQRYPVMLEQAEREVPPGSELWGADPTCKHEIWHPPGGGIACLKCRGWFCY